MIQTLADGGMSSSITFRNQVLYPRPLWVTVAPSMDRYLQKSTEAGLQVNSRVRCKVKVFTVGRQLRPVECGSNSSFDLLKLLRLEHQRAAEYVEEVGQNFPLPSRLAQGSPEA